MNIFRALDWIWILFSLWVIWGGHFSEEFVRWYVTAVLIAYYTLSMIIGWMMKRLNKELGEISELLGVRKTQ